MQPQKFFCTTQLLNLQLLPSPPQYRPKGQQHHRLLQKRDFRIPQKSFDSGSQGDIYQISYIPGDGTLTLHDGTSISRFAMKKIPQISFKKSIKQVQQFRTELELLYKLTHPNIVRYITHFQDEKYVYIVMEYIEGGNLLKKIEQANEVKMNSTFTQSVLESFTKNVKVSGNKFHSQIEQHNQQYQNIPRKKKHLRESDEFQQLNNLLEEIDNRKKRNLLSLNRCKTQVLNKDKDKSFIFPIELKKPHNRNNSTFFKKKVKTSLTVEDSLNISRDILSALKFLHSKKIMHRDIKLQNILLDQQNRAKLVDFGYLCQLKQGQAHTICGTPEYMAPEIRLGSYGFQAEVYACGVLMFELFTKLIQKVPQQGNNKLERVIKSSKKKLKFPKKFVYQYPDIYELISRMVIYDPNDRITIDEALSHRAFERIDYVQSKQQSLATLELQVVKLENLKLKQQLTQLKQQMNLITCSQKKERQRSFEDILGRNLRANIQRNSRFASYQSQNDLSTTFSPCKISRYLSPISANNEKNGDEDDDYDFKNSISPNIQRILTNTPLPEQQLEQSKRLQTQTEYFELLQIPNETRCQTTMPQVKVYKMKLNTEESNSKFFE